MGRVDMVRGGEMGMGGVWVGRVGVVMRWGVRGMMGGWGWMRIFMMR